MTDTAPCRFISSLSGKFDRSVFDQAFRICRSHRQNCSNVSDGSEAEINPVSSSVT